MDADLNKRYQTCLSLWFVMMMNIGIFLVISIFAVPTATEMETTPARLFTIAIAAAATFMVIISFAVKRKVLERSVETQDVTLVQKGLILACAMCEVSAVLGLVERIALRNNDHYVLFAIALIGTALHFPRREQLEAATYKSKGINQAN